MVFLCHDLTLKMVTITGDHAYMKRYAGRGTLRKVIEQRLCAHFSYKERVCIHPLLHLDQNLLTRRIYCCQDHQDDAAPER